jgi:hypothetical protein
MDTKGSKGLRTAHPLLMQPQEAREREARALRDTAAGRASGPEMLTDKDLDRSCAITLSETSTDFLLVIPCRWHGMAGLGGMAGWQGPPRHSSTACMASRWR